MERGYSVDYALDTLLSVIGLMKGKQLNQQPKQYRDKKIKKSIVQNKICLKFKCKLFIICTRQGRREPTRAPGQDTIAGPLSTTVNFGHSHTKR